jgi:hypothetical protein
MVVINASQINDFLCPQLPREKVDSLKLSFEYLTKTQSPDMVTFFHCISLCTKDLF